MWKRWIKFCNNKQIDIHCNRIEVVLLFLQELKDEGLGYNAINLARSCLSLYLDKVEGLSIGNHPLCVRFLKAVSKLRPPMPKYNVVWDPSKVLDVFRNWDTNDKISLKLLSVKLVCLLMLCTGQRVQTIHLIKVENVKVTDEGVLIFIPDCIKTSAPGRSQPVLELKQFSESKVCVVRTLREYLNRTRSIRAEKCNSLFISFTRPHKAVGKESLARWLKMGLQEAKIDTTIYSAHSFRHSSTSSALRGGANIDVIFKSAGWSRNSSVFAKFYNRTVTADQSFGNVVLSNCK